MENNQSDAEVHQAIWENWEVLMCEPCQESLDPVETEVEEAKEDVENAEGDRPRVLRDPGLPTQKQREEHDATHLPYRSWCSHCVRGSGRDTPSRKIKGEMAQSEVPRIHLDYCFFTENGKNEQGEEERTSLTTLVMKESECKSLWAYPVMHKGASNEPWVVKQILYDLDTIGLKDERIIVKNDQEPAIKDLKAELARQRGSATASEESRVGDSNSNATIEVSVQEVENMTRTLRSSLESRLKAKVKLDHPIVPWMIRHAAANITRFKVRSNGKTAFQLMKGFKGIMPVGEFGEGVLFRQPKATEVLGKYEDRWQEGSYLGFDMRSGEYIVGTDSGVFRSGAVRRRPADERWSKETLDKIKGDPEDALRRPPTYAKKDSGDAQGKIVPPVYVNFDPPEAQTRNFRIGKDDVHEHGATPGCAGCRAVINRTDTRNHSKTCRERFEKILSDSEEGQKRVHRAAQRMDEAVAREGEKHRKDQDAKATDENAIPEAGRPASSSGTKRPAEYEPDDPNMIPEQLRSEMFEPTATVVNDDPPSPTASYASERSAHQTSYETAQYDIENRMNQSRAAAAREGSDSQMDLGDAPTSVRAAIMGKGGVIPSEAERMADSLVRTTDAPRFPTPGTPLHSCETCQGEFVSKNRLFKHLRRMQHFTLFEETGTSGSCKVPASVKDAKLPAENGKCLASTIVELPKNSKELAWRYIGTGVYARTFLAAKQLITTTRKGPCMNDVKHRVIRDAITGKIIDECDVENTSDEKLSRKLPRPMDIRVELTMRKAQQMFEGENPDIAEIYSPPRIVQEASMQTYYGMQLRPGWSLDLTRKDPATQEPWDFTKTACRERAMNLVQKSKPYMLIGSPPCTAFSALQHINKGRRPAEVIRKEIAAGRQHLKFVMKLYAEQAVNGRYFLHEHPHSASSWALEEVIHIASMPGVETAVCHMCRFGMTSKDKLGTGLVKKTNQIHEQQHRSMQTPRQEVHQLGVRQRAPPPACYAHGGKSSGMSRISETTLPGSVQRRCRTEEKGPAHDQGHGHS